MPKKGIIKLSTKNKTFIPLDVCFISSVKSAKNGISSNSENTNQFFSDLIVT